MARTKIKTLVRSAVVAMCANMLAACGGAAEHPERAFVAPGKYILYDCTQLAAAEKKFADRDQELNRLITRAKQGPAGGLVASTVYEPEYYSNLGELNDVRREMADKKCQPAAKPAAVPKPKR